MGSNVTIMPSAPPRRAGINTDLSESFYSQCTFTFMPCAFHALVFDDVCIIVVYAYCVRVSTTVYCDRIQRNLLLIYRCATGQSTQMRTE